MNRIVAPSSKRIFIRAATVDHWDRHFQQPEVHR